MRMGKVIKTQEGIGILLKKNWEGILIETWEILYLNKGVRLRTIKKKGVENGKNL